jgi:type I restriction enzyme S subunit
MTSNYKRIGNYIRLVDVRNKNLEVEILLGLSISKEFIPSVANTVGTNMANYKIIKKGQFACSLMQVRRDKKIPVALQRDVDKAIISQAYPVFEVIDSELLDPEYLMMWMSRSEFDRHACFLAVGGVRGSLEWDDFCDMELPVPSIEKQREIVREYNVVNDRISLNEKLTQKLEYTAKAIYKQWFVDFSVPDETIVLTETQYADCPKIPVGWEVKRIDKLASKIGSGSTPRGGKAAYRTGGISLIRSMNVHDYQFIRKELAYIDEGQAKKLANVELESKDLLINITGVSVARCCVVPDSILPARVNQHVMIIRPTKKMSYYLQCALASSNYKSSLLGTSEGASTRQALTKTDIEEFLVLVPSERVLSKFEGIAEVIFSNVGVLAQTSQNLKELRSIILSRLATV